MFNNNSTFVLYAVELCPYIIPNVCNEVQTREIHMFTQGDSSFIWLPVAITSGESQKGMKEVEERD